MKKTNHYPKRADVRLSDKEYARVKKNAEDEKISISDVIRKSLINTISPIPRIDEYHEKKIKYRSILQAFIEGTITKDDIYNKIIESTKLLENDLDEFQQHIEKFESKKEEIELNELTKFIDK